MLSLAVLKILYFEKYHFPNSTKPPAENHLSFNAKITTSIMANQKLGIAIPLLWYP